MTNQHGLSRNIPASIKRAVRQRCGFGCIVCGASIYEYDHFLPSYADAECHDVEGITLLCPTHHSEKTRGILPHELIVAWNQQPTATRRGYTSVTRPYFEHIPSLNLGGGILVTNTPIPLMVSGIPIIEFSEPEEGSSVARISAMITNEDGSSVLKIEDNEWIVQSGVWDYEWVGQRMTIRDQWGNISLQIAIFPPKLISIDRLRFRTSNFDVIITQTFIRVNGSTFTNCVMSSSRVGLALG